MSEGVEGSKRTVKGCRWMLLALLCTALVVPVHADRPARPVRYVTVAPDGQSLFIMVPETQREGSVVPAHGTASRLSESGGLETLWQVEGWYARTYLASGGEFLVREGPWASEPPDQALALAFYEHGREIRRYVISELLRDPQSVLRSVSHYQWQGRQTGYPRLTNGGRFLVETVEGDLLTFDVRTGEIIDRRPMDD
jgi:hypothetical protein